MDYDEQFLKSKKREPRKLENTKRAIIKLKIYAKKVFKIISRHL